MSLIRPIFFHRKLNLSTRHSLKRKTQFRFSDLQQACIEKCKVAAFAATYRGRKIEKELGKACFAPVLSWSALKVVVSARLFPSRFIPREMDVQQRRPIKTWEDDRLIHLGSLRWLSCASLNPRLKTRCSGSIFLPRWIVEWGKREKCGERRYWRRWLCCVPAWRSQFERVHLYSTLFSAYLTQLQLFSSAHPFCNSKLFRQRLGESWRFLSAFTSLALSFTAVVVAAVAAEFRSCLSLQLNICVS